MRLSSRKNAAWIQESCYGEPEKMGKNEMSLTPLVIGWPSSKSCIFYILALLLFVFLNLTASTSKASELQLTQTTTIDLTNNATALAWHPNSKVLAVGGWIGMLTIWDATTGKLIQNLEQPHRPVIGDIEYSKDGKYLASGKSMSWSVPPYLSIFDASTFQLIDTLTAPVSKKESHHSIR